MPKKERSDLLRRRPEELRYFYLAVSDDNSIHVGTSYGSLDATLKTYGVRTLIVSDVVSGRVFTINESVKNFMYRWSHHYNDVKWDYQAEIERERSLGDAGVNDED